MLLAFVHRRSFVSAAVMPAVSVIGEISKKSSCAARNLLGHRGMPHCGYSELSTPMHGGTFATQEKSAKKHSAASAWLLPSSPYTDGDAPNSAN
jgi:hypothetical protein